jgi:glyoxylase-like metal-dependent hydrolase (beta-lactamase superfamily II)
MEVAELAPGLWRWTALHPDWTPEQGGPDGWEQEVGCVYCEVDGLVLLIDPLVPAESGERRRFWDALDRDLERAGGRAHVLLTCAWHARSAGDIVSRYEGTHLWAPADGVDDLPDGLAASDPFRVGEPLPAGVVAVGAAIDGEVLFWLPSHHALAAGDTLLGGGPAGVRLCPQSWLEGRDPARVRRELWQRLRELPVERVLVSHGEPALADGYSALERALAT